MGSVQTSICTRMQQEILEIPDAVERLLQNGATTIGKAADEVRQFNPTFLLSVARGSSDHACTYLKYVSELILQRPMASVGPSVNSIYKTNLRCESALSISISQSGMSPDIVLMTRSIRDSGGLAIAITNDPASDLAAASSLTLPIHAGRELSVAATKTFVTSLLTGLWLIAEIKRDHDLIAAIHKLPGHLEAATQCDWPAIDHNLAGKSLYTIGRGPSWAIANETALKFKETCRIQAESYSSAEIMHGPVSIVEDGFPIIAFATADAAEQSIADAADALANKGAAVFATTNKVKNATPLPHVRTDHWLTDSISAIVSFYNMVATVAQANGINPDTPRHLSKVTETL